MAIEKSGKSGRTGDRNHNTNPATKRIKKGDKVKLIFGAGGYDGRLHNHPRCVGTVESVSEDFLNVDFPDGHPPRRPHWDAASHGLWIRDEGTSWERVL
jgi:hypothetical protein